MPDTLAVLVPPATGTLGRQPALPGFLARKVFASGRTSARAQLIETCRAELAWSVADYIRLAGTGANHDARYDGPHPAEPHRLPHERAAATVLNVWGHLHPIERSIRDLTRRPTGTLRAQRHAAAADRYTESQRYQWARCGERTLDDLRWYLTERRKLLGRFRAAAADYLSARAVVDRLSGTEGSSRPCQRCISANAQLALAANTVNGQLHLKLLRTAIRTYSEEAAPPPL